MNEWQPIETYDKLKKKPRFAVFFFRANDAERHQNCLPEMMDVERYRGSRIATHWKKLETPK